MSTIAERFDENTLRKVYDALDTVGLDRTQQIDAVNEMQSNGILFRERATGAEAPDGR